MLEWTNFAVGALAAALGLIHTRVARDFTPATLGVGLLCAGILDAFHALEVAGLLGDGVGADGSWPEAAGRPFGVLVVAAGAWIAWAWAAPEQRLSLPFWTRVWAAMVGVTCAIGFVRALTPSQDAAWGHVWLAVSIASWFGLMGWVLGVFHPARPSYFLWGLGLGIGGQAVSDLYLLASLGRPEAGGFLAAHLVEVVAMAIPVGGLQRDFTERLRHVGLTRDVLASQLRVARASERVLLASRAKYEELFESSPELILAFGADGQLQYANQAAHRALGATIRVGETGDGLIHPFHRAQWRQALADALHGSTPVPVNSRLMREGGDPLVVEGTLRQHGSGTEASAVVAQLVDLTERRVAEGSLARFFTLSLDLLCILGFDGTFKRLNPAWTRVTGFSLEELMASPCLEFVHPEDAPKLVDSTSRVTTGMDLVSLEVRFRTRDGGYKWLMWTAVPVIGERAIYSVARDITELKTTREALDLTKAKLAGTRPEARTLRMALCIEPKPQTRLALTGLLEELGYQVVTAPTLEVGLRLAHDQTPELVTLDVLGGSGPGWGTLTALRADPALARTAVVGVSFDENGRGGHLLGEVDLVDVRDRSRMSRLFEPPPEYLGKRALIVAEEAAVVEQARSRLERVEVNATGTSSASDALDILRERCPDTLVLGVDQAGLQVLGTLRQDAALSGLPILLLAAELPLTRPQLKAIAAATRRDGEALAEGFRGVLRRVLRRRGLARTASGHWRPMEPSAK
jgi:PAS domain S-box-containing protein